MLEKRVVFVWAQETIKVFDTLVYVRRHQPTPSFFLFPLSPLFLSFLSSPLLFPQQSFSPFLSHQAPLLPFPLPYNLRPSRTPFPHILLYALSFPPSLTSSPTPFFLVPFLTQRRPHLPPQLPFPFPFILYLPLPYKLHYPFPLSFPLTPSSINPTSRINRGLPKGFLSFSPSIIILLYILLYIILYILFVIIYYTTV